MKEIEVVAAIIHENGKIFATQRGYGEFAGGWEFPGGKLEKGESPEHALVREIQEELNTTIEVGELIETVEYDYPTFHLKMYCYLCQRVSGQLDLLEHSAAKWLTKETLDSVEWLPADIAVVEKLKELL
ncbi:MAG TPA: 8-oxo-dGTP diphosphatase MutT [Enterococcus columbae]|nr:8-oxo-dGTP diphosphatase MutT [Enterococcus columbae]